MKLLYKHDSKGCERQWGVEAVGAHVIVSHGLKGGKLVDQITTCTPKNVGKANETTAEQQAELEAAAKHRIQIEREDYHEDIEQAGLQHRPMLAQDYLKVPHQVDWLCTVGQAKLDGLRLSYGYRYPTDLDRCNGHEFMSRKGEVYQLPHLEAACNDLFWEVNASLGLTGSGPHCDELDGEIYKHGWPLQRILSAGRRLQDDTAQLEFYLFDLVIAGMPFEERHALLTECMESIAPAYGGLLKLVLCHPCSSEADAIKLQGWYMKHGFEGAMLRHIDSEYAVGQRSSDLFKFKVFQDCECKIIAVWKDKNGNAMLTCEFGPEKHLFNCTPKRSHGERKAMLHQKEQLIGAWITVKYQDLTVDGLPSFPVGLAVRPCDDAGQPLV
jgi:ATP-dependent DNA ligase